MPYRNNEIKSGMIMMWSGLVSDVPDGWSICDGTNGTPDLQEKFIRGASGEVGEEGGCSSHYHTQCAFTGSEAGCSSSIMISLGCSFPVSVHGHLHNLAPSVYSQSSIPPYYELIFIRKD